MFQYNVQFGLPFDIVELQPVNIKFKFHFTYLLKVKPVNL